MTTASKKSGTKGQRKPKIIWRKMNVEIESMRQSDDPVPLRNVLPQRHLLTDIVSLDCEMVSCGANGRQLCLGRVTLVNYDGHVILDMYSRPDSPVTNYHQRITGLTAAHIDIGVDFATVADTMYELLANRTVVGHSLSNDFRVIFGSDRRALPDNMQIEDLADSFYLQRLVGVYQTNGLLKRPSLREMAAVVLKRTIQDGAHSSVEDARAAIDVYKAIQAELRLLGPQ